MNKYILYCFLTSSFFCFSEVNVENLDDIKSGIELGQKCLDAKVERYNDLFKKTYKKNQKNDRKIDDHVAEQDAKLADIKKDEEHAENSELKKLSEEIEKEQDLLDKKVEVYNQKLKQKADQAEDNSPEDLVGLLREEVQRLTNVVEHLQKEMKDFKKTGIESIKNGITDGKNEAQQIFEKALVALKNDVVSGVKVLEKFVADNPKDLLVIDANLKIGDAYNKIGRWDKSSAAFDAVLKSDKAMIPQLIEAKLGMAESQIGKNNREAACLTLIKLEKSNNPMSPQQLDRYQRLLVEYHCSSKMDRDERKKNDKKKILALLEE
jgi:tetratricopeptide (TPR) repeat protein